MQVTKYLETPLIFEVPSSIENGRAASWDVGMLDSRTEGPSTSAMAPYGLAFKYLVQLQAGRTVSCFSV